MTEEKKAIEYLRKWVAWETAGERNLEGDIETALNLIDEQQRVMKSQEKIIMEQEKEIDIYKKQEFGNLFNGRYISKDKIIEKIKILENINDSLKFVENRGYEPENYIINSNKYIINFLNKILEGGAK